jgi:hypothetical protein
MPAMLGTRATIAAPLLFGHDMPNQNFLHVRLSGYLEARRHAPDADQASTVIVEKQATPCSREARSEQDSGLDDRER